MNRTASQGVSFMFLLIIQQHSVILPHLSTEAMDMQELSGTVLTCAQNSVSSKAKQMCLDSQLSMIFMYYATSL